MIDDEEFFAWLDGELHGEAAERVAAAVAASPELTARADRHRTFAATFRGAFGPVMEAGPTSPRFGAAEIIDFGARATERENRRSWLAAPQWAAMAASLAIGVLLGSQFFGGGTDSPVAVDGTRLVAASALDEALDTGLASAPRTDGPHINLTFRDGSGRICRSFANAQASGLACRQDGAWQVKGLFAAAEGQRGQYRMAAGEDPRLAALVADTIKGEPFDALQEKNARDAGWR